MEWLLDVLYRPEKADAYAVFQIDDPDVLGLMGIEQGTQRYFSFDNLKTHLALIECSSHAGGKREGRISATVFNAPLISLRERMVLYQKLESTLAVVPAPEHVADEYKHYA